MTIAFGMSHDHKQKDTKAYKNIHFNQKAKGIPAAPKKVSGYKHCMAC